MEHIASIKKNNISSRFFADDIYAKILDSLVIACADSIVAHNGKILLAKRNINPRKDHWWIIGGRMIAGEDPAESARRKLFQEANVRIKNLKRFKYLGVYSTYFPKRHQKPTNNGSHTVNFEYIIEISDAEKEKLKLVKSEYSSFKWVPADKIPEFLKSEKEDAYITRLGHAIAGYFTKL